ncbi:jg25716 [Pararge aegeria aegeria]|nr:jg25716 [Pararge aegeria aegeria]
MHCPKLRLDEMLIPRSSILFVIGTDTFRKVGVRGNGLRLAENKHAWVLEALNCTRLVSPQSDTSLKARLTRSTKASLSTRVSSPLARGLDMYLTVTVLSSAYPKMPGFNRSFICSRKSVAERTDP